MCGAVSKLWDGDNSIGICSTENDFGLIIAANLMKTTPFDPLNAQQFPGCIKF